LLTAVPIGKYHPANYNSKFKIPDTLAPSLASSLSHMTSSSKSSSHSDARKKSGKGEDTKRKLQQYQRDMVAQAAMAGQIHLANNTKPISPRLLLPMNSPGSVTPMELEGGESQGYMAARGIKHEEMWRRW
jgi:hypothetical protein